MKNLSDVNVSVMSDVYYGNAAFGKMHFDNKNQNQKEKKMIIINHEHMRRFIIFAASLMLLGTASGCDWVQDRIPDDYNERGNTDGPADTGDREETQGTSGGAQTGTTEGAAGSGGSENGSEGVPTGPDGGNAPDGGAPPDAGNAGVTFEIPQGWYWMDSAHRTAMKGNPATFPDYYVPVGKIVLGDMKDGTDAEAKAAVQAEHAENQQTCSNEGALCTGQPRYMEIDIGGIKVYAAVGQPEYAEIRTTYAKFAKNGKVLTLTIYDDINNQMTLLDKVVTTVNW